MKKNAAKEIGDFVAHQTERIKGIATEVTREWCITAWFQFLIWQRGLDPARLPMTFPEFRWGVSDRTASHLNRLCERQRSNLGLVTGLCVEIASSRKALLAMTTPFG